MKAVRYYGKRDVRFEEDVPEPEVQPGTVKIRPAWAGLCGSDLHLYFEGAFPPAPSLTEPHPLSGETLPVVFGHEFSGVIEEIGAGVEGLSVGESVAVEPLMVCGECAACQAGRYNDCVKMGFIGVSGRGGGLSEHIVVESRWVHPVGDVPLDQAALIEPLSVSAHGARLAGVSAGDVVVIGGAGPIGLLAAAYVKAVGGVTVISELSAIRRDTAVSAGVADHVVDPSQQDLGEFVLSITEGKGADIALECAGVQPVLDGLVDSLKVGGKLVIIAIYSKNPVLDMMKVQFKELWIGGSMGYAGDHEDVIRLVQEGKINLAPFITRKIDARDIAKEGYEFLQENKDTQVKILARIE